MGWDSVNFDWNRARAFLVTAEEGSFSAAARTLNMTQPTLGRQVSALETELGVTLFERVRPGLQLTQSGIELLEHVRAMGEAANRFSLGASGQSQQIEGNVCISASEVDAIYRLPRIIKKLRENEPGIEIEVVVSNDVSDLKRREADIALRSFRPIQPDLIARKLTLENIWLYGTSHYLARFGQPELASDLSGIEIIGFDRSETLLSALKDKGWQLSQKDIPIITRFQLMQLELVKQHLGLGIFTEELGASEPELEIAFEHFGPFMVLPVWLVCHRELHTSRRVRHVFDVLVEELAD